VRKMPTKWFGRLMLTPIKQGVIAKGKKIKVEKKFKEYGSFNEGFIVIGEKGEILSVRETKNKIYIKAKFKKDRKQKRISKAKFVMMLLKSIDFRRGNLEKLLTRIFYFNFTEQDLERISRHKTKFKMPKAFEGRAEGESLYLKVKDKYYEV